MKLRRYPIRAPQAAAMIELHPNVESIRPVRTAHAAARRRRGSGRRWRTESTYPATTRGIQTSAEECHEPVTEYNKSVRTRAHMLPIARARPGPVVPRRIRSLPQNLMGRG